MLIYDTAPPTTPAASPDTYLGQNALTTANPAFTLLSATELRNPQSAGFFNGALYVADPDLNRVLVYSPSPTAINPSAADVIGQANTTTAIANSFSDAISAQTLSSPKGVFMDSGNTNLYVSDSGNNRVLLYSSTPTNQPSAAFEIGQATATTGDSATAATGMHGPTSICQSTNGVTPQMFIADPGNNRVLVYSNWSTGGGSGQAADFALGQTDLVSGSANQGGAASASTLFAPAWIACNGNIVVVSDTGNQRVLIYILPITADAQAATVVLGQTLMTATSANGGSTAPTASTLYNPHGIAIDGTKLYVADGHNNRILKWSTIPVANGAAANAVFGQSSFTTYSPNAGASTLALNTLYAPAGLSVNGGLLVIADSGNSRVIVIPEF